MGENGKEWVLPFYQVTEPWNGRTEKYNKTLCNLHPGCNPHRIYGKPQRGCCILHRVMAVKPCVNLQFLRWTTGCAIMFSMMCVTTRDTATDTGGPCLWRQVNRKKMIRLSLRLKNAGTRPSFANPMTLCRWRATTCFWTVYRVARSKKFFSKHSLHTHFFAVSILRSFR